MVNKFCDTGVNDGFYILIPLDLYLSMKSVNLAKSNQFKQCKFKVATKVLRNKLNVAKKIHDL